MNTYKVELSAAYETIEADYFDLDSYLVFYTRDGGKVAAFRDWINVQLVPSE